MEVVYKKTVVEKMDNAILEAKKDGREIEKFIFNREEWIEWLVVLSNIPGLGDMSTYLGYPISVEKGR